MFCAFEGAPLILRLYGHARMVLTSDDEWGALYAHFDPLPGARQIFDMEVDLVHTSCGFGVPLYEFAGERSLLNRWAEKKGDAGIRDYWREKNSVSLDGESIPIAEPRHSRLHGNDAKIANCTAVILAGGESRRMGQDKAQVEFRGKSLLNHAIANLSPLFDVIVLSVREPIVLDLPHVVQVMDGGEERGPMMGIVAAMAEVRTDWVFVTGVDMPFVVPAVLQQMANQRPEHDAVLAEIDSYLQPIPAFYAKAVCLPAMQHRIDLGHRSLMRLLPSLNTAVLTEKELRPFDSDLRSFTDFDTPEDVRIGEQL